MRQAHKRSEERAGAVSGICDFFGRLSRAHNNTSCVSEVDIKCLQNGPDGLASPLPGRGLHAQDGSVCMSLKDLQR